MDENQIEISATNIENFQKISGLLSKLPKVVRNQIESVKKILLVLNVI